MKVKFLFLLLILLSITACSEQKMDKEVTIAILEGEEIKVKDILWQFSLEENAEDIMKAYLKLEIVLLEAKEMGITVSEKEIEESKQVMNPGSNVSERYKQSIDKEFYQSQASRLGISPEEYFAGWEDRIFRTQSYMNQYIDTLFGYPDDNESIDEWGQNIDQYLEELFNRYIEDGRLLIKY